MKIKIVGIDISLSNLGLALATYDTDIDDRVNRLSIDKLLLVETEIDQRARKQVRKNSDDLRRAVLLQKGLQFACRDATVAMVEMPVGSKSARAMASYGICIGVMASCPIPLIQLTPYEVKEAAVGHKQAAKEEMIAWGTARFPNANWRRHTRTGKGYKPGDFMSDNEHLADACAAICAGLNTDEFARMMSMVRLAA